MTTLPQTTPMRFPRSAAPSHLPVPGHGGSMGPMGMGPHMAAGQGGFNLTGADVLRVLRANLWLILLTVIAFSVGGFFFNKYLAKHHSRYTARGLLEVYGTDEVPTPEKPQAPANPAEIELVQRTQAMRFLHPSNFLDDIQKPDSKIRQTNWFKGYQNHLDEAKIDLEKNLSAVPQPSSRLIEISMTCADPQDAHVILEELVEHHIQNMKETQKRVSQKKLELLTNERDRLNNLLDSNVLKPMADKEKDLGGREINTFQNWNGKQQMMQRLIEEKLRILAEIAGFKARLDNLESNAAEGRTPPDIETIIRNTGTYTTFRFKAIDYEIELKQIQTFIAGRNDQVVALQQTLKFWQEKAETEHEELRDTLTEGRRAEYKAEQKASEANLDRIEKLVTDTSAELGRLNQSMTEYGWLKKKEAIMRERLERMENQMSELQQFAVDTPWAAAQWGAVPVTPDHPSFPRLPYTMAASIAIGLVLSLGIAFLREMTDTTVRSDRDIAKVGQLNLLGMVQHEADDPQAAGARLPLVIFDAPHSMVAEQFRQLRTKLQHSTALDTTRSILITSPSPADGKSTVAANIAAGLALNGRRILLVDSNFRKPSLHTTFGVDNAVGFSDALNDVGAFDGAVAETEVPNLSVMPAGERPANPTELFESQLFIDFVERALEEYDHVIFDGGPLLVVSDAIAMAPRVDGVISVVRARGNSRGLLIRMRDELRKVKAEHLGVVLNAVRSQGGGYYGRSIKTYYAYHNH